MVALLEFTPYLGNNPSLDSKGWMRRAMSCKPMHRATIIRLVFVSHAPCDHLGPEV